jgi:hypothetical protein
MNLVHLVVSAVVLAIATIFLAVVPSDLGHQRRVADPGVPELRQRAQQTASLAWLDPSGALRARIGQPLDRAALLRLRSDRAWAGDRVGEARINALLAGEATVRSRRVLDRWLMRFDPTTGLLPNSTEPDGQLWAYGDTGSDLFPHLAIATHLLAPDFDPLFTRLLAAERRLGPGVPDDVRIPSGQPVGLDAGDRIFGVAEYAKDGLLPMVDRLGPDPWLGRLVEIADALIGASATPTPREGMIPANTTEVNGDVLQILARVYWATGDARYLNAAGRIGRTYLEDVFPTTVYLPPNKWDFVNNEPLDRRRFRLSDHGNEILPGLLEWHLAASLSGDPNATRHRAAIRRMLDRIAERGRNQDGLWWRVMEIPSGRVDQDGFTDNWGYVSQAFLVQSLVERVAEGGDPRIGARYHEVAAQSLRALPRYRFYLWQSGEMDGYADAIESAVYILHEVDDATAAYWTDEQLGVLYGFQHPDGSVLERDLDGNFIRTALLEAARLTAGARLEPWSAETVVGASRDGACVTLLVTSQSDWSGRLVFDRPRHADFTRMPYDYARLNKWPEWFVAEAGVAYRLTDGLGEVTTADGRALQAGLPLEVGAGQEQTLQVCRVS